MTDQPKDLSALEGMARGAEPIDTSHASLEKENQLLRKVIKEERFLVGLVALVIFDVHIFPSISASWGAPLAILILEVILIIIVGRKCDVQDIKMLTDGFFESFGKRK